MAIGISDWEYIDGCANKESRLLRPIRKIIIKGAVSVFFRRSENAQMVVAGDTPEAVSSLKTQFKGDTLVIEREGLSISISNNTVLNSNNVGMVAGRNIVIESDTGTMVFRGGAGTVVLGDIVNGQPVESCVNVSGGCAVVGVMLPESPFIEIQGSGNVTLQDVKQNHLGLEVTGSGDINVQGEVKRLNIEVVGSGDVEARDLISDEANLRVVGSGDIEAFVRSQVRACVSGSGDIVVFGNPPHRDDSVVGSGKIKFR